MEISTIKNNSDEIIALLKSVGEKEMPKFIALKARAKDFVATVIGKESSFFSSIECITDGNAKSAAIKLEELMASFNLHLDSGFANSISIKRKAEIDVVSDILEQAQVLLNQSNVHPAAPTVLIGASLEEYLRNWVEDESLTIGAKKPGIDSYSTTLREADLISKQDVKDINSWGGLRNHAAHGEWDLLGGKDRIRLMLDGVNLFMRRYTKC